MNQQYNDIHDKLSALKQLQDEGLITEADFVRQKQYILDQFSATSLPQDVKTNETLDEEQSDMQPAEPEKMPRKRIIGWVIAAVVSSSILFVLARLAAELGKYIQ